ncbi:MAG: hypothetical protein JF588_19335 [Caulobacterales bacterium]|nr:hypothetical protein [Caulobacterales bacterium]
MGFIERGARESLAEHLLKNAEALGCDADQVRRLRHAFRLMQGGNAQKAEGGQVAVSVRRELEQALAVSVRGTLQAGERLTRFNDDGAVRVKNRDGLETLLDSGAITEVQARAGLAYRLCFEAVPRGLGSCLGRAGEGGGGMALGSLVRSPAELKRAYLVQRLGQLERAVRAEHGEGEVTALRAIAGECRTVLHYVGRSGHARLQATQALGRALDVIAQLLRITGS